MIYPIIWTLENLALSTAHNTMPARYPIAELCRSGSYERIFIHDKKAIHNLKLKLGIHSL
jgi:hypothetical protein